jgi:uncharacterized protein (TIGR02246 family)
MNRIKMKVGMIMMQRWFFVFVGFSFVSIFTPYANCAGLSIPATCEAVFGREASLSDVDSSFELASPLDTGSFAEVIVFRNRWAEAVGSGNVDSVLNLYQEDAVLLPTLSNQIREGHTEMRTYFESFLERKPKVVFSTRTLVRFMRPDVVSVKGDYTITTADGNQIAARYMFIYSWNNKQGWLIADHHSSISPQNY